MDLDRLCAGIKERVALELQQAADPEARGEILIAALYETSRTVLPALGPPRKSVQYLKAQGAVLELVSCIAIPLIWGREQRGVAVLSELAEGCRDPLLKKKLSVYAQQLLARSSSSPGSRTGSTVRVAAWLAVSCAVAVLAFSMDWPDKVREQKPQPAVVAASPVDSPGSLPAFPVVSPVAAPAAPAPERSPERSPERVAEAPGNPEQGEPPPRKQENQEAAALAAAPQGEQVTRVRIINNQVLVPVTLKHGGTSVRLELVLDTGSTRTGVHEAVASRLPIDLISARTALAEVADGRIIRSRIARIDTLSVGPFAHASMELELIPYVGSQGVHDGLLGMDFLGRHRYQIDMEHELIHWF